MAFMTGLTIVYLSAYHESDPCSGDVVSVFCEIRSLRENGFLVCELFRELGIDKPGEIEIGRVIDFLEERELNVDVVITAQPEILEVGVKISNYANSRHVFRQHLDYNELAKVTRRIGIDPARVFTRLPYKEMLSFYNEALKKADYIVSSGVKIGQNCGAKASGHFVSFPPVCMEQDVYPNPSSRVESACISIAISGRFDDPLKGAERVLETVMALSGEEGTPNFVLNTYGNMPDNLISRFQEVLGDCFIYKGWISERSEYFSEISRSDIFIAFPYYESYGMAIHEAIELGLVPLSTKCGIALELSGMLGSESLYSSCFMGNEVDSGRFAYSAKEKLLHIINNIESMKNGLHDLQSLLSHVVEDSWSMSDILKKADL